MGEHVADAQGDAFRGAVDGVPLGLEALGKGIGFGARNDGRDVAAELALGIRLPVVGWSGGDARKGGKADGAGGRVAKAVLGVGLVEVGIGAGGGVVVLVGGAVGEMCDVS